MSSVLAPRRRRARGFAIAALALAWALAALLVAGEPAEAARGKCAGTFRVLHNDRIGKLKLPKGKYKVIVFDQRTLSCGYAYDLFRQFLLDYDGKLPDGWRVRARNSAFFQPKTGDGFKVKRVRKGTGGGGGGGHTVGGKACPNLFHVLHNDRIGRLKLKEGWYRLTLVAAGRLNCERSAKLFAKFLRAYHGKLPGRWRLDVATATFTKSRLVGFRVKRVR